MKGWTPAPQKCAPIQHIGYVVNKNNIIEGIERQRKQSNQFTGPSLDVYIQKYVH